jgi:hypothetical protein
VPKLPLRAGAAARGNERHRLCPLTGENLDNVDDPHDRERDRRDDKKQAAQPYLVVCDMHISLQVAKDNEYPSQRHEYDATVDAWEIDKNVRT